MANAKASSEEQGLPPVLGAALQSDTTPWYKKPHLLKLNYIIFSITLYASANGYDGSLMNGLQALDPWQEFMDYPTGSWLGSINSVGNLGALSIIFLSAWTVQKYGRRVGIYIGNLSLVLGTVLQSVAHNPATFILGRAFIGVANQWLTLSAGLWITETAFPAHRGIAAALYSCGWYPGSLLAAWVTFGTRNYTDSWSWRIPSILQIMIPTIALPGLLLAPESPRYLVSVGKIEEARDVLLKYHSGGNSNDEVPSLELDEIVQTLRREKTANESSGWADLFKTRGTRHRAYITITMGIFGQWCGNGVVSFYLTLVLNSAGITGVTEQTLINGFLQVWNLIWAVGAAFSVDRLGRRMLFLASALIMGFSYVFVTAFSGSFAETGSKNIGIAVVPFLFIFYAGYDLAFTPLFMSYAAEIWPYNLRSRGLSLVYLVGQTATFLNVFANPIALDAISWKYYIVYVAILIIGFINMYLTYPETKGHTLEGIREIFDGKNGAERVERDGDSKHPAVNAAPVEL